MLRMTNKRHKDYLGGGLMLLLGIAVVVRGMDYSLGTFRRMGPGFFPVALGVILALLGAGIVLAAKFSQVEGEEKRRAPEWRGWACIMLSLVAFVGLGKYGGLVPATFAVVFISALGDRQNTILSALLLSLAVIVICLVVFVWALQMHFPLFGWG